MELQGRVIEERNARLQGSELDVIIDRVAAAGEVVGRTQADAPDIDCVIRLEGKGQPGEIRRARVTGHDGYDLEGALL
jgi:ribosomal protein S12 methylthiotransferase